MTYPLACDDIVQLTLILVSFNIYALTLSGGPLGAKNDQIFKINEKRYTFQCHSVTAFNFFFILCYTVTLTDTPSGSGYTSSVLLYIMSSINVYIELFFITPFTNQ